MIETGRKMGTVTLGLLHDTLCKTEKKTLMCDTTEQS